MQRDLGKALALMTQRFSRAYRDVVKDDPTLAKLEQGNVRTALTFDPAQTQVKVAPDEQGRPRATSSSSEACWRPSGRTPMAPR
ncbi:hypothetical protein ACN28S_67670 [Cystobacter fuscus]